MLRHAERIVDYQVQNMGAINDKLENMIRLAAATLSGGVVIASFFVTQPGGLADGNFRSLLVAGGILNLASIIVFLDQYLGILAPMKTYVGPGLVWVAQKAGDSAWTLADHYSRTISQLATDADNNRKSMHRVVDGRRIGILFLLAGLFFYFMAAMYALRLASGEAP